MHSLLGTSLRSYVPLHFQPFSWAAAVQKLPTAYLVLLSMVILLFVSPRLILQLGFQLSYLAVFGILFLLIFR